MPIVYHMVHYRRFAGDAQVGGKTLEALCRGALDTVGPDSKSLWERPLNRLFDVGGTDGRKVFLNKVADLSDAVFGEMCLTHASDLQTLLSMTPSAIQLSALTNAVVFTLDERKAPVGSEFIRGLAYWMAIGNHVFFVKTHSMTPELIRLYLDWILKVGTVTLPPAAGFSLQAEFDRTQGAGDIGDIKSFRLAGKAAPQLTVSAPVQDGAIPRDIKTSRRIADKFVQMQEALPVVKALLGGPKTESLVESLGPKEYLAVDATVKVRGRRTQESKAAFKNIVNDLADMTDAEVRIEGKDGKMTDGDAILRTRMPFNLPYDGSNLLEFDHVADQLREVYSRFVKDGKIKA